MKKLIKLIFILLVLFLLGYFIYTNYINAIPKLNVEEEKIECYFIGTKEKTTMYEENKEMKL